MVIISRDFLMLYRHNGGCLKLTCLPLDLIVRLKSMCHEDLTLGHSLSLIFSWIGIFIIFIIFMPVRFFSLIVWVFIEDRTRSINRKSNCSTMNNTTLAYTPSGSSDRPSSSTSPVGQLLVPATSNKGEAVWPSGYGACLEIGRSRVQGPLGPFAESVVQLHSCTCK